MHVSEIGKAPSLDWKAVVLDEGAKGPVIAKIARLRVIESRDALPGEELWLFLRYCPESKETKYFLSNAPEDIPFQTAVIDVKCIKPSTSGRGSPI